MKSLLDYKLQGNGWVALVNEDITKLNDKQAALVNEMITSNMVLVFKKQNLSPDQEVEVAKKIGYPREIYNVSKPLKEQPVRNVAVNEYITRITGKKNSEGKAIGSAGQPETFDWHIDRSFVKVRAEFYWLYAAEGSLGSCTSFLSFSLAYSDLSKELKERISGKKVLCGTTEPFPIPFQPGEEPEFWLPPIVNEFDIIQTTPEGVTWLHYPPNQVIGMTDTSDEEFAELSSLLKEHVLQEKFMYHHYWEDGDVLLADQRSTMHKRWAFERMSERVMHRMTIWSKDSVFRK